jgi:hypothetical protein
MTFARFLISVLGSAAGATAVLAIVIKLVQLVQTRTAAAVKDSIAKSV